MLDERMTSETTVADRQQADLHAAWLASWDAPAAEESPARARPPVTVAWLGYGGLLPFIVFAGGSSQDSTHADLWRGALFSYAAVILSFVGALHWGFAMTARGLDARQRAGMYMASVIPALLAWPALLVYATPGMVLLIAGFVLQYGQDWRLAHKPGLARFLPAWYLPLRLRLSCVACVCVAVGALWRTP